LSLTLGADIVKATDVIRVLGVLFTPDLALEKQVTSVSTKCFFQLRQLRHVRRSLDRDSAATLVHAFVTSRIDYGNAFLANTTKIWTEKLQRVLNAAARVITGTWKFDCGLSHIWGQAAVGAKLQATNRVPRPVDRGTATRYGG